MDLLSVIDEIALGIFLTTWFGYTWVIGRSRFRKKSITHVMGRYRHQWMEVMSTRKVRMVDTQVQGALMQGVGFLASTSVLMVAILTATLGLSDNSLDVMTHLPPAWVVETASWKLKIVLVSLMFVYAFFKLLWCYRLFNYCAILIGATREEDDGTQAAHIRRLSAIHILAGDHFNAGLRAFYFAVAALCWLLHPYMLIAVTAGVLLMLMRRDFASRSLAILLADPEDLKDI